MKAITPIVSIVVLVLITVGLMGSAWIFLFGHYEAYISKPVRVVTGASSCKERAVDVVIQNMGTGNINLSGSPLDFEHIGNMVPNNGFEEVDTDGRPIDWVHEPSIDVDVVLVTDLSNSMSDCMDPKETTPDMDTVLLMHMDNDIHVEDSSGKGNHGGIMGSGLDCSVPGNLSFGCNFDGADDYVKIDSVNGDNSLEGSYAFWLYQRSIPEPGYLDGILVSDSLNPYMYINSDGRITARVYSGSAWEIIISTPGPIPMNEWVFYTFTYNSTGGFLYENGNIVGQDTITTGNYIPTSSLFIGSDRHIANRYIDGIMDELIVLNRSLSPQEVSDLYQAHLDGNETLPDPDTILLMHMDEGRMLGRTEDNSGHGNNGTVYGVIQNDSGVLGEAFQFNGNDNYIHVPHDDTLTGFESLTLEAWVYINEIQSRMTVIGKHYNEYEMIIDDSGTRLMLYKTRGGSYVQTNYNYVFETDKWYHLAVTWNGSIVRFYINGEYKVTRTSSTYMDRIEGTHALNIGRRSGDSNYFNGMIDEVAIYSRALTEEEIRSHAKALVPGECAGVTFDANTILRMHMEDNNIVLDSSGNENHGLATNNVDCSVSGQLGYGCSFDGDDDQIDVGDHQSLDITGNMTISAWVNSDFSPAYHTIIEKGEAAEYTYRLYTYGTEIGWGHTSGGGSDSIYTAPILPINMWAHVAVARTWNGTDYDMNIYVNGTLAESGHLAGPADSSAVGLFIGNSVYLNSDFNGSIDEVVIYNRTLTQQEIQDLYNAQLAGTETSPGANIALLMHMNEGRDFRIKDNSSYNNDGTTYGDVDCTVPGKYGLGCSFDGNGDYVDLPNAQGTDLDITSDLTITAWIYPTTVSIDQVIFAKGRARSGAANEQYLLRLTSGNALLFLVSNGTDEPAVSSSGSDFVANTWYHVAGTFNSSGSGPIKVYINGIEAGSDVALLSTLQSTAFRVGIGADIEDSKDYFNGIIDDVMIFNRTLTGGEIETLAKACLECPDDGQGDMPSRCRYETALCPQERPITEESYAPETWAGGSFQAPEFRKVNYSVQTGTEPSSSCILVEGGCDGDTVCTGVGRVYNGSMEAGPDILRAACLPGECENGYDYSDCSWQARTTHWQNACPDPGPPWNNGSHYHQDQCKVSCLSSENDIGGCGTCSYVNRTGCSTNTVCVDPDHDFGDNITTTWRPFSGACLAQECDTGETRHTVFECVEACDEGYSECGECGSCFETCCCLDTSYERECEQRQDYCCENIICSQTYDGCCNIRQPFCRNESFWCCDPLDTCVPNLPGENLEEPCTPGFVGGFPDPASNCDSSVWQCRADGGSCYICDSVAIRLAKKLDSNFVDYIFPLISSSSRMGLVSYGSDVSVNGLTNNKEIIDQEIDSYHADKGDTCIACAIASTTAMLNSPESKKYMVLMSDGDANIRDGFAVSDWNGDGVLDARDDAIARACQAGEQNITIYAVGFGKEAGNDTLQRISDCGANGSKYFQSSSPEELQEIYQEIAGEISEAFTNITNKVYGERSMSIDAEADIHVATSSRFDVYIDPDENYNLSFYMKLRISSGAFKIKMKFFDDMGMPLDGNASDDNWMTLQTYTTDTSGEDFVRQNMDVNISNDTVSAVIFFGFDNNSVGTVLIDDVYFGPIVRCIGEGQTYICGDITIIKTSSDGDVYPYFNKEMAGPKDVMTFRDGNCKGQCNYKIMSPSNAMDVPMDCQPGA